MKKSVSKLTISDFEDYPIWTWVDDDGDEVTPVQDKLINPDEFDAVFVSCKMTFQDGTIIKGAVAVHVGNEAIYLVDFPYKNNEFISVPLQPTLTSYKDSQLKKLCKFYSKELSLIFPLKIETTLKIKDNLSLDGYITI